MNGIEWQIDEGMMFISIPPYFIYFYSLIEVIRDSKDPLPFTVSYSHWIVKMKMIFSSSFSFSNSIKERKFFFPFIIIIIIIGKKIIVVVVIIMNNGWKERRDIEDLYHIFCLRSNTRREREGMIAIPLGC